MISPAETTSPVRATKFAIPSGDLDLFASLNDRTRKLVKRRLKAMSIIAKSPTVWAGCQTVAALFHGERGWSAKRLDSIYCEWQDSGGNWRTLVDSAIAGPAWQNRIVAAGLPDAFLDHLAQQWSQNQRDKFTSVYTSLVTQYRRWHSGDPAAAIPGYETCPAPDPLSTADLPAGWTYSNLKKQVNPRASKFARKLVQIGPKHASNLGPQIPGTRFGAQVGQYYIIDDSWNDFKIVAYGQTCRLLSFHILDLLSGCNIGRGHKPALKDQETQTEERLREKEIIWLLVKTLTTEGYRPTGTTIICEKATATLRKREREILAQTLGDTITIMDGPAGGGTGIPGLFTGRGGGNPRWKAPLESWFNLLRNRTADLLEFPGQTGSNSRINQPEGLPGLEKDTLALLKAIRAMAPEKADLLKLGMLSLHEAIYRVDAMIEVINCRTDHHLEGWRDCGHYTTEWRIGPAGMNAWQPATKLLEYSPEERNAIAAVLANNDASKRERPLSPREVFDAGKDGLVKLPLAIAALLMDELPGTERPVKNNQIELMVSEVDPEEPLVFGLTRRDGRGTQEPLRNEEKYMVRVNPLDPRVAYLFTADNRFAGVSPYYGRVQRADAESLQRAYAAKRKALAPLVAEGRRLASHITQDATERTAVNTAILGQAAPSQAAKDPVIRAETKAARDAILSSTNDF